MEAAVPDITDLGDGPEKMLSVAVALLVVCWVTCALRVWARSILINSFGWDDWTMILTICAFTVQCGYLIKIADIELLPEKNNNLLAISGLVTDIIAFTGSYVLTTVLLKISLAFFFLRITVQKWQRGIIYAGLVAYTTYGIVYFALTVFGCGNPANYLLHTAENKCISVKRVIIPASYAQTALNGLTDWIYALLPIYSIVTLQLPRATKFWACVLLGLGALGSIASLVRLRYVPGLAPGENFFHNSTGATIWSTIEPGLGIAAASLATLRPLMQRLRDSARSLTGSQRAAGGDPSQLQSVPRVDIRLRQLSRTAGWREVDDERLDGEEEVTRLHVKHDEEKGVDAEDAHPRRYY